MKRPVFADKAFEIVLRKLASGAWAEGAACSPVRQVADEMRVSPQPVQQAYRLAAHQGLLDVRPKRVAVVLPGARDKARAILAARDAQVTSRRLAVLIPEEFFPLSGAPFQSHLAQTVLAAARHRGFEGRVVSVPTKHPLRFSRRILRQYDAAFVIDPSPTKVMAYFALAEHGFPMLSFNREIPGLELPTLRTDDESACRQLGRIMVAHGHRNICLIETMKYEYLSGKHVLSNAWLRFLEDEGLLDGCSMPVAYHKAETFGMVLERLLRIRPRVTGIVLGIPSALCSVIDTPAFCTLRIPQDISVAAMSSVSHMPWPSRHPAITCFELDWERTGQCALEMIQEMLAGNANPKAIRVPLNIQLTDSIGPP
ncbi:MAG TPA: substrate-binding domain-containing protein [Phycisphaerae bacterium]|nr:substrate-binding domain-containing protein [Phycisphaerae bacterium]HOI55084.1 substrate-binding domain-containing protein [Phycisphaerae bacterium]